MKDLDEYTSDELQGEINRRSICFAMNRCDYCGGDRGMPTAMGWSSCRFPSRHGMEEGHVPHLIFGFTRHDGSIVTQCEVTAFGVDGYGDIVVVQCYQEVSHNQRRYPHRFLDAA